MKYVPLIFWYLLILSSAASIGRAANSFSVAAILTHTNALAGAHDIELEGNLAFVAGKGGSIAVVDIGKPEAPEVVWFRRDNKAFEDAETVLPLGGHLLLGTRDFLSFNVSNPRDPIVVATLSERPRIDRINGFARRGDFVFAANKQGWINVFDVTDAGKPRLHGARNVREKDDLISPHDVDMFGDHVVMVDARSFGRLNQPGRVAIFRVVAVEDSRVLPVEDWTLISRVVTADMTGLNRIKVSRGFAYAGGSFAPEASQGKTLAKGIVIDVRKPAEARQVAAVNFSDVRGPNGLALAGRVWFLGGGQTVEAYDISIPDVPKRLAVFKSPEAFPTDDDNVHDLVYRKGYLYVTSQSDHRLVTLKVEDKRIVELAEMK